MERELMNLLMELVHETRQTNQLLTELNDNLLAVLTAEEEPDATPTHDMDGNLI